MSTWGKSKKPNTHLSLSVSRHGTLPCLALGRLAPMSERGPVSVSGRTRLPLFSNSNLLIVGGQVALIQFALNHLLPLYISLRLCVGEKMGDPNKNDSFWRKGLPSRVVVSFGCQNFGSGVKKTQHNKPQTKAGT